MTHRTVSLPVRVRRTGAAMVACGLVSACTLLLVPTPPPRGSPSEARLRPGPYGVETRDRVLDAGGPRPLTVTTWSPRDAPGPRPLVVYSHGFLSNRRGGAYLAEHLASHGTVVAAPDHPGTRRGARGGPRIEDVVNQPKDVSRVIDALLAPTPGTRLFDGEIDPARIGVVGLSLGGLTATLVAFHPRLRDRRVRAAVSIAGPTALFTPSFFAEPDVPFLMIAGTGDVVVEYDQNAAVVPERVPRGDLVSILGASHAGFDQLAGGPLRLWDNPDTLACWVLERDESLADVSEKTLLLGGAEDGIAPTDDIALPCTRPPPEVATDPVRQHEITELAVTAFFESHFGETEETRRASRAYLEKDLPADFPEVVVELR